MTALVFVDTNILVYAREISEPMKQQVAAEWLERLSVDRNGCTSMQVLNECYSVLTRKIRPAQHPADAWRYVTRFLTWTPLPVDDTLARRAREVEQRYGLNWWDCLIVAAAQVQSCSLLLTEDLQHRTMYGSVSVRNPFKLAVCDPSPPEQYGNERTAALRSRWRRIRARYPSSSYVGL